MKLRYKTRRRIRATGIAAVATLTAGGIVALVSAGSIGHKEEPVSDHVASYYAAHTKVPTLAGPKQGVTVAEVIPRLEDATRPFVFTVMGDSTGNASDEWVYLAVTSLSSIYKRPAVIHNWSIDTNTYASETPVGSGAGEPIVVWNGSASGMNASYSMEHREAMAPMVPDLLVVNHGHNVATADQAGREVSALVFWAESAWANSPAVAVTLQNPRFDENKQRQADVVTALRKQYEKTNVGIIDVYSAFESNVNPTALVRLEDGFHPNFAGEQIWASTALQSLIKE